MIPCHKCSTVAEYEIKGYFTKTGDSLLLCLFHAQEWVDYHPWGGVIPIKIPIKTESKEKPEIQILAED